MKISLHLLKLHIQYIDPFFRTRCTVKLLITVSTQNALKFTVLRSEFKNVRKRNTLPNPTPNILAALRLESGSF